MHEQTIALMHQYSVSSLLTTTTTTTTTATTNSNDHYNIFDFSLISYFFHSSPSRFQK